MRKQHGTVVSPGLSEETKRNIYFYHHSIEDHIESLAKQAGGKHFVAPITTEVVRLLEAKTLWETFLSTQSLPEMRTQRNGNSPSGWARGAAWGLEADLSGIAPRTRPLKRRMSAKGRKAIQKAQHERWKKARSGWSLARRAKYSKMMKERWADPKLGKKLRRTAKKQRGRTMSPEARAKISASRKANFAAKKAAA